MSFYLFHLSAMHFLGISWNPILIIERQLLILIEKNYHSLNRRRRVYWTFKNASQLTGSVAAKLNIIPCFVSPKLHRLHRLSERLIAETNYTLFAGWKKLYDKVSINVVVNVFMNGSKGFAIVNTWAYRSNDLQFRHAWIHVPAHKC